MQLSDLPRTDAKGREVSKNLWGSIWQLQIMAILAMLRGLNADCFTTWEEIFSLSPARTHAPG
jgi:hypothetical protein